MTTLEKLEHAIQKLRKEELASFREWFVNYDSEIWDHKIENDILNGKLDNIANNSLNEHNSGSTTEL